MRLAPFLESVANEDEGIDRAPGLRRVFVHDVLESAGDLSVAGFAGDLTHQVFEHLGLGLPRADFEIPATEDGELDFQRPSCAEHGFLEFHGLGPGHLAGCSGVEAEDELATFAFNLTSCGREQACEVGWLALRAGGSW